jgi:hypothetical protein
MSLGVTRRLVAAGSHLGFQRGIRRSLILNELGVISPNWGRFSGLRARAPLPPQGGSQAGQPSAEIAQDWPSRSARGDDDASGVARRRLECVAAATASADHHGWSATPWTEAIPPVAAWRGRRIIPTRPAGWRRSLSSCSPPLPLLTDRQPGRTAAAPGQWAVSRPSKAIPRRSEGPPTLGYGGWPMCGPGP